MFTFNAMRKINAICNPSSQCKDSVLILLLFHFFLVNAENCIFKTWNRNCSLASPFLVSYTRTLVEKKTKALLMLSFQFKYYIMYVKSTVWMVNESFYSICGKIPQHFEKEFFRNSEKYFTFDKNTAWAFNVSYS